MFEGILELAGIGISEKQSLKESEILVLLTLKGCFDTGLARKVVCIVPELQSVICWSTESLSLVLFH